MRWVQRLRRANGDRFRGWCKMPSGRMLYGPTRTSEHEAYADAVDMRRRKDALPERAWTFADAIDAVRVDLRAAGRRPGTLSWFECHVRALCECWPLTLPLARLTADQVDRFVRVRRAEVSDATVRHHLRALSRILRLAVRQGRLQANPLAKVTLPAVRDVEAACYTAAEVGRILAAIGEVSPDDAELVACLYHTGLRRSEAGRMRAKDVDLAAGTIRVDGKRRARSVPINGAVRALLERRVAATLPAALLFGPPHRITRIFATWSKRLPAGLGERFRPHTMRHSFATALVRAGVQPLVAARLLGHSTLQMTLRYYHADDPELRAAVARLE